MGVLERFSLRGRVALVTGGAGPQFGSSLSEGLAEADATVVTVSRSLERNEVFAAGLRERGYEAHAMQVDISDSASVTRLHESVMAKFGRVDVLVNSALGGGSPGRFGQQPLESWEQSARAGMVGLYAMCRAFIPEMVRAGGGSVINISSIFGVVSNDPTMYEGTTMVQPPSYPFVKAGVVSFTRYLAAYYGKAGVRANCISPGGYFNNQPEPFLSRYEARCPIGRMLDNDDIKGAVVFLASDAGGYVTGHNLLVDGGWTIV